MLREEQDSAAGLRFSLEDFDRFTFSPAVDDGAIISLVQSRHENCASY
jgi:hypothetical protein